MNAIVQTLNTAGQAFLGLAVPMLIQSSLLILILLAVDALLRKRVRAVFRYWIWMLVLVKLVLPPSLWSPVSVGTWFGDTLEVPTAGLLEAPPLPSPEEQGQDALATRLSPAVTNFLSPPQPITVAPSLPELAVAPRPPAPVASQPAPLDRRPAISLNWQGLLLLIWAGVVAALLLLLAQRTFFVRGLVAQAAEASRALLDELDRCRQHLGLRKQISARLSPNAASPAVCGLWRPVILIPQNLAARLHGAELQAVLFHELAHIKRGDLWINLLQTLLQILYFYHPLLWLANAVIRRIREKAVDEMVLVAMGEAAPQYPDTLIHVAKLALARRPGLSLRLIGVVESKSALTSRIKHILNRPLPKTAKLGLLASLMVLVTAAVLLPMAQAAQESAGVDNRGPLDIRLVGVCPDGGDELYDADGKKLDTVLGPLGGGEGPWKAEEFRRDFVLQVPRFDGQLLFLPFASLRPAGTGTDLGRAFTLFDAAEGPAAAVVQGRFRRTYRQRWAGLFAREVPVRKVDLTLRYFHGGRGEALCSFTGPFTEGTMVQADEGRPYQLTPREPQEPWGISRLSFDFTTGQPFDSGVPLLVYDRQGRRYLAYGPGGHSGTSGTQLTYTTEAVPWEQIATITAGEKPQEITFRNLVVDYPQRPARTHPAHLDEMAERLGLTGLSPENLARYGFKMFERASEAVAVLDILRGSGQIQNAMQTITYGRPRLDFSALDAATREKVHRAALSWLQSPHVRVRAYGVELGLKAGFPEFVDPAFALLDYRHPTYPQWTRDVHFSTVLGLGRYKNNLTPADIERLKQFVLRCDDGYTWGLLFEHCFHTSSRPAVSDALWELAQEDRPWLWWPALKALLERRDERVIAYSALPESMKLRVVLAGRGAQPEAAAPTPQARALLRNVLTVEMLRMYASNWWDLRTAVTTGLDRKEATAVYMDLLAAALPSSMQGRFERDYGSPSRLYDAVSSFLWDINSWYGINLGQLGIYQPGAVNPNTIHTARAFEQAVTEALNWYRTAGQPQPAEPVFAGRVVDTNGRAIAGAVVTLTQWWDSVDESGQQRQHRVPAGTVQTGADGRFVFRNLVTTRFHNLSVEAPGFAKREDMQVDRLPDGRYSVPRSMEDNAIVLEKRASLSGRIVGLDGQPPANALVRVESYPTYGDPRPSAVEMDVQGRFTAGPLMSGYHLVRYLEGDEVHATGTFERVKAFQTVRVEEGQAVENVTLDLRAATAGLAAQIVDSVGQPARLDSISLEVPLPSGQRKYVSVMSLYLLGAEPRSLYQFANLPPLDGYLHVIATRGPTRRVPIKLSAGQTTRCKVDLSQTNTETLVGPSNPAPPEEQQSTTRKGSTSSSDITAVLPNGVTVELLGACEYPSEGKQWWRPDGAPLAEAPYDGISQKATADEKNKAPFELALRVGNLPEGWDTAVRALDPGTSASGDPPDKAGKPQKDLRWLMIEVDPNQTTCAIRCAVAGAWRTVARGSPQEIAARPAASGSVAFSGIQETGTLGFSVGVKGLGHDSLCRVLAVTHEGEVKESLISGSRSGLFVWLHSSGDAGETTADFWRLPLSSVKELQLQIRPVTRVDFRNVPLRRGLKPFVKVDVHSADRGAGGGAPLSQSEGPTESPREPGIAPHGVNIYLLADENIDLKAARAQPLSGLVLRKEPWIASANIERYDLSSHAIYLKNSRPLPFRSVALRGSPFVVTADGQRCYLGSLWTGYSSFAPEQTTPLINLPNVVSPPDIVFIERIVIASDSGEPAQDVRQDPRVVQALTANGQLHAGLEVSLDRVEVLPREGGSSVRYIYTLRNKDTDNLYVFDPDKMSVWLFHYFNNPPFLLSARGYRGFQADTSLLKPSKVPDQLDMAWLSLLKSAASMTRTVTVPAYSRIPPDRYVCSFRFHSPGRLATKDKRERTDGRIWVGQIDASLSLDAGPGELTTLQPPRRTEADKGAGGGALAAPGKAGGILGFRIAPMPEEVGPESVQKYKQALMGGGRPPDGDFAWFEVRPGTTGESYQITCEHDGKTYVLLWNDQSHVMRADGTWGVEEVREAPYEVGNRAITWTLDEKGIQLLHELGNANVRHSMAVVFEGRVIAIPFINTTLSSTGLQIIGRFTPEEIQQIIAGLKKVMAQPQAQRSAEPTAMVTATPGNPVPSVTPGEKATEPAGSAEALKRLLAEAQPGGVVTIPKGRYTMPVEITKPMTLRGESAEECVIEVTANQPALLVNTQGQGQVTVENLTIRWQLAGSKKMELPAALLVKGTNVLIRNCRFAPLGDFQRSPMAVYIDRPSKSMVDNCRFSGFSYVVCYGQGTEGVVQDCLITDCGHQGVINYDGAMLTVQRNIITGSRFHVVRCTGGILHVKDNLLIKNANRAVYLGNKTGQGTITNNLILGNGSGISGFGRANYVIANNVVADNSFSGIDMRDSCRFSIRNNVLVRNQRGLALFKEGTENYNVVGKNAFWANATDVENLEKPAGSLTADPQFADPNHGDFTVQGAVRAQEHGLTNPQILKDLWQRYEQLRTPSAGVGQPQAAARNATSAAPQELSGRVVDANSKPVAGAQVALCTEDQGVTIAPPALLPTDFRGKTSAIVKTDAEGRFSFPGVPDAFVIIVAHETGFARVKGEDFSSATALRLEPWGQVEGILYLGREPGVGKTLKVSVDLGGGPVPWPWVGYDQQTKTQDGGRFSFPHVAPGWVRLSHYAWMPDGRRGSNQGPIAQGGPTNERSICVKPGQALRVTIGGTGRPVIGKLVLPQGSNRRVGQTWAMRTMDTVRPEIPKHAGYDRMTPPERDHWRSEWAKTPAGQAYRNALLHDPDRRSYNFPIDTNDCFRIEDVIPGRYELRVWLWEEPTPRVSPKPIGPFVATVEVPPMTEAYRGEPLDLGKLTLRVDDAADAGLAWQRTDRYVPPDPNSFFPDDPEAGKKLDTLFQAVDKDQRSDEEILSTVRQGFRRTTRHRTSILAWIGNRYIGRNARQDSQAIEIMYHAVPLERHYAVYFGLSIVRDKTPNLLRTLADVCMQSGDEVGQITLELGSQREALLPYLTPYLQDQDAARRERAAALVKHFKGELNFEQWQYAKHQEQAKAEFGGQLPQFEEILRIGGSSARNQTLATILRHRLVPILDDSFLPALRAASADPDRGVRRTAVSIIGTRWLGPSQPQDPNVIELMLQITGDSDREVRYSAVYYGLSVVRDKSEGVVRRLVELSLTEQEANFYGRIVWGLKNSVETQHPLLDRVLAGELAAARTETERAALRRLCESVLGHDPSASHVLSGRVVDPNGRPATGAQVALAADKRGVEILPPRLLPTGSPILKSEIAETDAEGRFSFPETPKEFALVASHETGFARVDGADFTPATPIRLERWGRIEGTRYVGRQPLANGIMVLSLAGQRSYETGVHCRSWAETTADGRFVFPQAAPGWLYIGGTPPRGGSASSVQQPVYLKPGGTLQITVGGTGRPVIGKLILPPDGHRFTDLQWGPCGLGMVTPEQPKPPGYDRMSAFDRAQWYERWRTSPQARVYFDSLYQDPNQRSYHFTPEDDNSFRIDDVIPGRYEFRISLRQASAQRGSQWLGPYRATIEVPPMTETYTNQPLDLGEVMLKKDEWR